MIRKKTIFKSFILFVLLHSSVFSQKIELDNFDTAKGWKVITSDDVTLDIAEADGIQGKCLKFDYNFIKGTGYGGIQKVMPINLPENYQFSFYIKATSPENNLEFKLLDKSGDNVWWDIKRNFEFPEKWEKIIIKKRQIKFAWGPAEDKNLKSPDKIEFTISSSVGGKGTVYLDNLQFEKLPIVNLNPPQPSISASSSTGKFKIANVLDKNEDRYWKSNDKEHQEIILDLKSRREIGGITIYWAEHDFAKALDVYTADNLQNWELAYSIKKCSGGKSFIRLDGPETNYIKIVLLKSERGKGYIIKYIKIENVDFSEDINDFIINIAREYPRGFFPRYFYREASYWTVVGTAGDVKESLINEEGMVEVDKGKFSIEPFIYCNNNFISWNDVNIRQALEENYLPIPTVNWENNGLELNIKAFAEGKPNKSSSLYLYYELKNNSSENKNGTLFITLRPFQVNPYYQDLNMKGGVSKINSIQFINDRIEIDDSEVLPVTQWDNFGTAEFDEGGVVHFISKNEMPVSNSSDDHTGLASGVLSYSFNLKKNQKKTVILSVPYYPGNKDAKAEKITELVVKKKLDSVTNFWNEKVNHVKFNLPHSADKLINTVRSNLAYILINKDKYGIQPGSRSYERSWIRDGALTSAALLRFGIQKEVRDFIEWYKNYLYPSGKVPCVIDSRGPDPTDENDSNGEFIYLIYQYFKFTKDTTFLRNNFNYVQSAVSYINSMIKKGSTNKYRNGNDSLKAFYGLVPESISHEGYSAHPEHSYWDDFFVLLGLKDAAKMASILGKDSLAAKYQNTTEIFRTNFYNSIKHTVKMHNIDYIPGSVELGDYDPTSTSIAVYPCGELNYLPAYLLKNTFDKYYNFFTGRKNNLKEWKNFTPYEVRIISTFLLLDEVDRAHELAEFFINYQRPAAWNQWAEVVWKDYRFPGFIGDMPHTWVGSDFISAVRNMFVYEDEFDSSLVICAGLYSDWINSPKGISINNLPTYYGNLSYSIVRDKSNYNVSVTGSCNIPSKKLIIKNFNNGKPPKNVYVNGNKISKFNSRQITVDKFPAEIIISY